MEVVGTHTRNNLAQVPVKALEPLECRAELLPPWDEIRVFTAITGGGFADRHITQGTSSRGGRLGKHRCK